MRNWPGSNWILASSALVTGTDTSMEGGIGGIQLQVPEECMDAALALLGGA